MKLTRVEQAFDGSRLIFYFTADSRVDFRELVRELAAEFRTRIEMRQIGVRDEAQMLGGYGSCGRPLCCTTWLQSFEPVSIKMAKQQDLSLNPSKLSGLCGRLKCCLRYELPNGKGEQSRRLRHEGGCSGEGCSGGGSAARRLRSGAAADADWLRLACDAWEDGTPPAHRDHGRRSRRHRPGNRRQGGGRSIASATSASRSSTGRRRPRRSSRFRRGA